MRNTSKFWSINFMDANFFYYSIYDRFIQREPCACVCKLFLLKTFPQKLLTGFLPNFTGMFLNRGQTLFFTVTEKSGLCIYTGAQAPLV